MNPSLQHVTDAASKPSRTIVGLMSGTSLDGLDITLCHIQNSGSDTIVSLEYFASVEYPDRVIQKLKRITSVWQVNMEELCLAHSWLADYHADLIMETLREWQVKPHEVDAIASHGQTVFHAPSNQHQQQGMPNATLQIGDGDHIARKTGILTLSDFRQKHTAVGGEGAPMVALVDEILYSDPHRDRLLLNIGGIANFTFLPARDNDRPMICGDTGPGNTLINTTMQDRFAKAFDRDGATGSSGTVHPELLKMLAEHPYFSRPMPKTTGPEVFNLKWVEKLIDQHNIEVSDRDLVATLTWLSAETIVNGIKKVSPDSLPEIYVSGGGMHNKQLMDWIRQLLDGMEIHSFEEIGFNPDAKEAVCFAVLANETLAGNGFLINPQQGAERRVNFGKISLPV